MNFRDLSLVLVSINLPFFPFVMNSKEEILCKNGFLSRTRLRRPDDLGSVFTADSNLTGVVVLVTTDCLERRSYQTGYFNGDRFTLMSLHLIDFIF